MISELTRELQLLTGVHEQVLREAGLGDVADQLGTIHTGSSDDISVDDAIRLAGALTVHLHLVNLADERHRVRLLNAPATPDADAGDDLWPAVTGTQGLQQRLEGLHIHPVLTAHPTEARRRAIATALRRVSEQLQRLENPRLGLEEKNAAHRHLLEEVELLHRTSVLRTTQPEPLDEVRTIMTVFDQTLIRAVPRLYRALEQVMIADRSGTEPTPVPAFLRFGSWVGGDRDGNPFVTADVTRRAMGVQSDHALSALEVSVERVGRTLTADQADTPPSRLLREALERDAVAMPERFTQIRTGSPGEPHRQRMLVIAERLKATRAGRAEHSYRDPEELIADLRLVQDSLAQAGARRAAYGDLQHVIWYAQTFGFHLAELEVRQHSDVHEAALVDLLSQVPDAPEDAAQDAAFLDRLARFGWPENVVPREDRTREILDTLRVMSWLQQRHGVRSCGRYIVSFSHSAANLVAVRALARLACGTAPLRLDVVPLFETGADLAAADTVLAEWVELPSTREWLDATGRRVEVMLGYSDSAKDVGPAAATLTLAQSQSAMVAWAQANDIELTMFHGRGGSLGRGGGPLHRAILAQPPGSVDGRLKVTEQGEVVFARYADTTIAQRHLERLTTAVLLAGTPEVQQRNAEAAHRFAALGERLVHSSRAAYWRLVRTPGFADVLAEASPLEEIGELRMGSRPVRRSAANSGRELSDLRAIPWVFAWSQTRANISGWYGLGTGLSEAGSLDLLREAYAKWPLFASLIDIAEMSLAKSNRELAQRFLSLGGRPEITAQILEEMDRTTSWVLQVLDQEELLEHKQVLGSAIALRAPYVDALSRLQLEALTHVRSGGGEQWRHLLLLTVNGLAAGLQNTG
ncbi:MAG: phosphoenolpyruvate carboxylase [Candidatus Nanopelagicales bacterium]|nr:phosphoenolpyruvate carboxylase [Candidatus Nanopelagicales bacterium]